MALEDSVVLAEELAATDELPDGVRSLRPPALRARADDRRDLRADRAVGDRAQPRGGLHRSHDEERDGHRGADLMYAIGTFARDGEPPFPGLRARRRARRRSLRLRLAGHQPDPEWLARQRRAVIDGMADGVGDVPARGAEYARPVAAAADPAERRPTTASTSSTWSSPRRPSGGVSRRDEALALGTKIMDERVAAGEPYIFLGAASAVTGPYDDVVLPSRGEQHDWELELAAVIGVGGRHIARERGAGSRCRLHDRQRPHDARPRLPPGPVKAIGSDWLRAKNAPTFLPLGPWIVPGQFVADPQELTITLQRRRRADAGRVDRRHDLRRGHAGQLRLIARDAAPGRSDPHRLAGRKRHASPALPARRAT